jgi:hypothetical protein
MASNPIPRVRLPFERSLKVSSLSSADGFITHLSRCSLSAALAQLEPELFNLGKKPDDRTIWSPKNTIKL